jgi:hypothetical protein
MLVVASAALLMGQVVLAQVNEKFADLEPEIQLLRSMAQTDRKDIVAANMTMNAEEGQVFWPLYNQYRTDVAAAQDKRVKVITDYAATYRTLTDVDARKLVDDYLKFQAAALKVRERYVGKFAKILPGTKVARFFQIENRLDALTDLIIAREIPLSK